MPRWLFESASSYASKHLFLVRRSSDQDTAHGHLSHIAISDRDRLLFFVWVFFLSFFWSLLLFRCWPNLHTHLFRSGFDPLLTSCNKQLMLAFAEVISSDSCRGGSFEGFTLLKINRPLLLYSQLALSLQVIYPPFPNVFCGPFTRWKR